MKMRPLFSDINEKKAFRKASRGSKEQDTLVEKKQKDKKKEKEDRVDRAILDTDVKLRLLKDKYRLILEKELRIARANQAKDKKNSANYSKIGVAYYSLNVINAAQERLRDLSSSRELYCCMRDMSAALSTINGLDGKIGRINPKGIVKEMKRMTGSGEGASKDLVNTLSALSGLETESEDKVSLDSLVSVDVIDKLINGGDIDNFLAESVGVNTDANELMYLLSNLPEGSSGMEENIVAMDDIEAATQNIANLLDQL